MTPRIMTPRRHFLSNMNMVVVHDRKGQIGRSSKYTPGNHKQRDGLACSSCMWWLLGMNPVRLQACYSLDSWSLGEPKVVDGVAYLLRSGD